MTECCRKGGGTRRRGAQPFPHRCANWPSYPLPSRILASFISGLFNFYEDLYFTYLEINPLGNKLCLLGRDGNGGPYAYSSPGLPWCFQSLSSCARRQYKTSVGTQGVPIRSVLQCHLLFLSTQAVICLRLTQVQLLSLALICPVLGKSWLWSVCCVVPACRLGSQALVRSSKYLEASLALPLRELANHLLTLTSRRASCRLSCCEEGRCLADSG